MSYFHDDGFGSRFADNIINESYYSGFEDDKRQETKGLTKAEENAIIKRLAELMKGCGSRKNEKV